LRVILLLDLDLCPSMIYAPRYIACRRTGVHGWNRLFSDSDVLFRFLVPHPGFGREVGINSGHYVTPDGAIVDERIGRPASAGGCRPPRFSRSCAR
jgi:benzoyl-CoA 2,3-dioxygenase component B